MGGIVVFSMNNETHIPFYRSIFFRSGIAIAIPLIAFVLAGLKIQSSSIQQLAQSEEDYDAVEFSRELGVLVYQIGYERGLTAGLELQENPVIPAQLLEQRQLVDREFKHTQKLLNEWKNGGRLNIDVEGDIVELKRMFGGLQEIRGSLDDASTDHFSYYTQINEKLLEIQAHLISLLNSAELVNQLIQINHMDWMIESAGQERGLLNNFFSSGTLTTEQSIQINYAIHEQTVRLRNFTDKEHHRKQQQMELIAEKNGELLQYRNIFLSRLKKQELLRELRGILGFGGMIHNFKNYVIRSEERYRSQFLSLHQKAMALLSEYHSIDGVTAEEKEALQTITETIDEYKKKLAIAASYAERGSFIVAVDKLVKVDDEPALKALVLLATQLGVDAKHWFKIASDRIDKIHASRMQAQEIFSDTAQSLRQEMHAEQQRNTTTMGIVIVLLLLATLQIWRSFIRSIRMQLDEIQEIEESGDLSRRIRNVTKDEIGRIGGAQNRLLDTIEQSNQEVYRLSKAKDEFLASMSHELRTPLTSIIGFSEQLSEQLKEGEDLNLVRCIESAGRTQLALVNDILDLSKIESGKFTIEEAPYDLARLLQEIHRMLEMRANDRGIEWKIEQRNDESKMLLGDSSRIAQVLVNLAGNAIKFTHQGSVTLISFVQEEQLIFRVVDTGIGMSQEVVSKLFGRFQQADNSISRRFGGSGLGLFISQSLSEMMGGSIFVESEEGRGSTFEVRLPYKRSGKVTSQEETSVGDVLQGHFEGHVLVAEDTPMLQMLVRRMLEKMGITVTTVNNGLEVVEQVAKQHFDLILMDMQMPEMDGIEATRKVREVDSETPIVALTANVMKKHREQFEQAGSNGLLGKPIDRDELQRVLKCYLMER